MNEVTLADKQFVAGFVDGDGCILLRQPRSDEEQPWPMVAITQACASGVPPELAHIQMLYGGRIGAPRTPVNDQTRPCWHLVIGRSEDALRLLNDLDTHATVKAEQAHAALAYVEFGRNDAAVFARTLSQLKTLYSSTPISLDRITLPYMAGLFAAEGFVDVNRRHRNGSVSWTLRCCIAQHSCPALLVALRDVTQLGCVTGGTFFLSNLQAKKFLREIRPYLVGQKMQQVDLALHFQENLHKYGRRRTAAEEAVVEEVAAEIKRLKRQ